MLRPSSRRSSPLTLAYNAARFISLVLFGRAAPVARGRPVAWQSHYTSVPLRVEKHHAFEDRLARRSSHIVTAAATGDRSTGHRARALPSHRHIVRMAFSFIAASPSLCYNPAAQTGSGAAGGIGPIDRLSLLSRRPPLRPTQGRASARAQRRSGHRSWSRKAISRHTSFLSSHLPKHGQDRPPGSPASCRPPERIPASWSPKHGPASRR